MFRKLVSNLPFNPSILGEISFYYGRLKREESLRRYGMILVVLSLFVQAFAIIQPPEPTLAASSNDVLYGGFRTKAQAVSDCRSDRQGFRDILAYHGISCDLLEKNATYQRVKSTDYGGTLKSMGRESRGDPNYRTGKRSYERRIKIGGTYFYMRNLNSFDSGAYSSYDMLKVTNAHGDPIFIMYSCGNIATPGDYNPPPPPPPPPSPTPTPEPEPTPPPTPTPPPPTDQCTNIPGFQHEGEDCFPCPEASDKDEVSACIKPKKTAANITQGIENADGTLANANDTIVYTLTVVNEGRADMPDFSFEEDISDVLHYATLVDADGGTIDDEDVIRWPSTTIAAKSEVQKNITVKVKDPIPQTPISTSDPHAYDLIMNNTFFGNTVNIELPRSVNKTVEIATKTLPSTGPGESMLAAGIGATVIGYFLARTHLLRKETQLVRLDYAQSGGE